MYIGINIAEMEIMLTDSIPKGKKVYSVELFVVVCKHDIQIWPLPTPWIPEAYVPIPWQLLPEHTHQAQQPPAASGARGSD